MCIFDTLSVPSTSLRSFSSGHHHLSPGLLPPKEVLAPRLAFPQPTFPLSARNKFGRCALHTLRKALRNGLPLLSGCQKFSRMVCSRQPVDDQVSQLRRSWLGSRILWGRLTSPLPPCLQGDCDSAPPPLPSPSPPRPAPPGPAPPRLPWYKTPGLWRKGASGRCRAAFLFSFYFLTQRCLHTAPLPVAGCPNIFLSFNLYLI